MKKNILTILIFATIIIVSCKKEKAEEKVIPTIPVSCSPTSFSTDILPIFQTNCNSSSCHDSGNAADGVSLTNHTQVIAVAESRLIGSIKHQAGFTTMPYGGGSLTTAEITKIDCWIKDGKQNN